MHELCTIYVNHVDKTTCAHEVSAMPRERKKTTKWGNALASFIGKGVVAFVKRVKAENTGLTLHRNTIYAWYELENGDHLRENENFHAVAVALGFESAEGLNNACRRRADLGPSPLEQARLDQQGGAPTSATGRAEDAPPPNLIGPGELERGIKGVPKIVRWIQRLPEAERKMAVAFINAYADPNFNLGPILDDAFFRMLTIAAEQDQAAPEAAQIQAPRKPKGAS